MTLRGKVRKGASRGKQLGFPTANIFLHKKVEEGIYLAKVKVGDKTYNALTFIGSAKTFNEKDVKAESYLLDFSGSLYDKWITVYLLKKLRENQKFSSANDLVVQMEKDLLVAQEFFASNVS